jgi:hypothetical protein
VRRRKVRCRVIPYLMQGNDCIEVSIHHDCMGAQVLKACIFANFGFAPIHYKLDFVFGIYQTSRSYLLRMNLRLSIPWCRHAIAWLDIALPKLETPS